MRSGRGHLFHVVHRETCLEQEWFIFFIFIAFIITNHHSFYQASTHISSHIISVTITHKFWVPQKLTWWQQFGLKKAVFRCFFGQNPFSRPNDRLSPLACHLESLWFNLSYLEPFLKHPTRRQNFANTLEPHCAHYLTLRLNLISNSSGKSVLTTFARILQKWTQGRAVVLFVYIKYWLYGNC